VSFEKPRAAFTVDRLLSDIRDIIVNLRRKISAPVFLNNFPLPLYPSYGIFDFQEPFQQTDSVITLNQKLLPVAKEFSGVYMVNFMNLFARIGGQAIDSVRWQSARAPLGKNSLIPVGKEYGKYFRAVKGKNKKCLVLDCDNTLWGGIVGEDGLGGIKLDSTYPGSCYRDFQQEIINLYQRGIILALCSKNDENDVFSVLEKHPGCLLKKEHFAAWRVNWEDKAGNIIQIAKELNIGLDSIVFADDNPFETMLVAEQVPEVAILDLSGDPAAFRQKLLSCGFFDALSLTKEDRERTKMYLNERERRTLQEASVSIEEYLKKLKMVAKIEIPDDIAIPRVAQLTQKTNQFNLTTKRYTEAEIKSFLLSDNRDVFYLHLRDNIAELGIVGVAILVYEKETAVIDTFLLSCRALGRKTENVFLTFLEQTAALKGAEKLIGRYVPTAKNAQTANFYKKSEFSLLLEMPEMAEWVIDLTGKAFSFPDFIKVN
jgi:FkbH-like protein